MIKLTKEKPIAEFIELIGNGNTKKTQKYLNYKEGWRKEKCTQKKIGALMVKIFENLLDQINENKKIWETKKVLTGLWLADDVYDALKEANKEFNLEKFREYDKFFYGEPPLGFDLVKSPFCYILSENTSPADAITFMGQKFCLFNTLSLVKWVHYKLLLTVFGERTFNKEFGHEGKTRLSFCTDYPLQKFFSGSTIYIETLQVGDYVMFKNASAYHAKHAKGWNMQHAICKVAGEDPKFIGGRIGKEGLSLYEVFSKLVDAYNEKPIPNRLYFSEKTAKVVDAYQEKVNSDILTDPCILTLREEKVVTDIKKEQINLAAFKRAYLQFPNHIGLYPSAVRLDAEKIKKLLRD